MALTFVYPPTLDWQFMFQRPQQLAAALARRGHRFYFCQKTQTAKPVEPASDPAAPGVHLVHDFERFAIPRPAVLFTSWAKHHDLAARADLTVFDHLDAFAEWEQLDGIMLRQADVVLCTSEFLMQRAMAAGREPIHVPNACDPAHWQRPAPVPHWLAALPEPRVLFSGCLGQWVDVELIQRLAEHFTVVCVGANWRGLKSQGNLHIVRERPYAELPAIFRGCQVGIIPFLQGQVSQAADPIKQYEYAAAGLPFIASNLPEVRRAGLATGLIESGEVGEWAKAIRFCLDFRSGARSELQRQAEGHTWDRRADQIERVVIDALAGKAVRA